MSDASADSAATGDTAAEIVYAQHRFRPAPGATEVFLVRHGESAPARLSAPPPMMADGQADPDLAPTGQEQAERVGARLAEERLDALYVTTLRRTVQTAEPLAAKLGMQPEVEPELREIHLGDWEGGLFRKNVQEGHPLTQRMWAEQNWAVLPGAEDEAVFRTRITAAINRIAAAHPDRRVAVFTHGGVIAAAFAHASGAQPFAFLGADNGSISHLVVDGEHWIARRFNDTAHLPAPLG